MAAKLVVFHKTSILVDLVLKMETFRHSRREIFCFRNLYKPQHNIKKIKIIVLYTFGYLHRTVICIEYYHTRSLSSCLEL